MLTPGGTVGRYRIVGTLGRGAVGTTWEAEPVDGGAHVAIKELRLSRVEDWKLVELFEREARVLAHIAHPAVPAYVDHFVVEQDREHAYYLVQALAPGRSLAALAASGWRADEIELRRIAESLLEVLEYLHERMPPVFHRDIKPENVLREETGKIWLVDFGAVRDVYRTTTGGSTVAGTFGYMAPEQLRGVARPESDLYGVAATLVFVASGQSPAQMPQRKLKTDFHGHVHVSPQLTAWLDRMLEPAPEDRFSSAKQALAALRSPSLSGRRGPPRRLMLLSAGLATVLAGAGVVGVAELREQSAAHAKALAAMPRLPSRPIMWGFPAARWIRGFGADFIGVLSAAFTPDGSRLLTGSHDATLKIWDAKTGAQVGALPGHTAAVGRVLVTADGKSAISAGDKTLRVWSLPDGAPVRTIAADPERVYTAALSPDGRVLAAGGSAGRVPLFALDGTLLRTLAHGKGRMLGVAFTPDGTRIVTAGDDATIKVWDVASGTLRCELRGHTAAVGAVAVAPDGQVVASASDDHTARVWHMGRCAELTTLSLHEDEVWSIAYSPDGGTLVTGGKDPVLGFWAMPESTLRQRMTLNTSTRGTMGIAFAPDGVTFLTTHGSGAVQLWKLIRPVKHEALPPLQIVEPVLPPTATPEQRTYAEAMATLDGYHGQPGLFTGVEKQLEALRQADPQSALTRAALARLAYKRWRADGDDKQGSLAAQLAGEAIDLDPKLADAYVVRGWVLQHRDDAAGARAAAETAHTLDPTSPRALVLLAQVKRVQGDLEGAEKAAREVLSRPVGRLLAVAALEPLADLYVDTGDTDGADAMHRHVVELDADSAWRKQGYANFLMQRHAWDAAIGMAQQAIDQMRFSSGIRTLALAYCAKGEDLLWYRHEVQGAQDAFNHAARVDAHAACAPYGLGAIHQWLGSIGHDAGQIEQAKAQYAKAVSLDPSHEEARSALAALSKM